MRSGDWTGFEFNQKGPHGGRFVHLDRLPARLDRSAAAVAMELLR